jgi:hypothetical protein
LKRYFPGIKQYSWVILVANQASTRNGNGNVSGYERKVENGAWTHLVPRKINTNPIYYDEIFGIALFFFPLITVMVTTICVSGKERLIEYVQRAFLILALLAAMIIFYEFRRIGATIYTFRFSSPTILWMSLRALAQLLALGAMLAYW